MIEMALLPDFITETVEHLEEMEDLLLTLEKNPEEREVVNDIFRVIHTIKGGAQFIGLERTSELAHTMENLLDIMREGQQLFTAEIIGLLIDTKDRLTQLIVEVEADYQEESEISDLLSQIRACSGEEDPLAVDLEASLDLSLLDDGSSELDLSLLDDEDSPELDLSLLDDDDSPELDLSLLDDDSAFADGEDSLDLSSLSGEEGEGDLVSTLETALDSSHRQDDPLAGLRQELAAAHDEELVAIFYQQAITDLQQMLTLFPLDIEAGEQGISQCQDLLAKLRSSAHYMGYDLLTDFMDQWLQELGLAREAAGGSSEPVDLSFMDQYAGQLMELLATIGTTDDDGMEGGDLQSSVLEPDSVEINELDRFIQTELIEDGQDEELFGIFTAQASIFLHKIDARLGELTTSSDPALALEECVQDIQSLRTAANYMDYGQLVGLLDEWQQFSGQLNSADVEDLAASQEYLRRIARLLHLEDFIQPLQSGQGEDGATDLFTTLSNSMDQGGAEKQTPERESFHYVLEEMLTGDNSVASLIGSDSAPKESSQVPAPAPERRGQERRQSGRRKPENHVFKQTVRVDFRKIDELMNQVGELVVNRAYFSQILSDIQGLQQQFKELDVDPEQQKTVRDLSFRLAEATVSMGRISSELQEGVMKVRMLPVAQIFNRYPRLVRDLTMKSGKEVELVIKGGDTELDKMVIEEISDPLIHIIRNSIDHGMELPDERKVLGKPEVGTLILDAYHESNHIVIEVSDDGRGIDVEAVKSKAIDKKLASTAEIRRMTDVEAIRFIMLPGFSTAGQTTETSGRGVGMDVIKSNIEKLNGTVEVESEFGEGTTIRIKIPLTMAIIQALLIRVADQVFTLPLSVVEETLKLNDEETSTIEGVEVIHMRDATLPIFKLSTLFNLPSPSQDDDNSFVVVVSTGMQRIGLVVDQLIGQEEVVIKPLVDYLRVHTGFSGATIIGDGRISLILDVYELVKIATQRQARRHAGRIMGMSMMQPRLLEGEDVS